jgi:hypothetical protein
MRARKQTTPTATQTAAEHEQAANPITRRRKTAVWLLIVVSTGGPANRDRDDLGEA